MKVYVLVDNTDGERLKGEWGLSFYIEHKGRTVLLDAGLSALFAENAEKMGLDLQKADIAVLSHAHDDQETVSRSSLTKTSKKSPILNVNVGGGMNC